MVLIENWQNINHIRFTDILFHIEVENFVISNMLQKNIRPFRFLQVCSSISNGNEKIIKKKIERYYSHTEFLSVEKLKSPVFPRIYYNLLLKDWQPK